MSHTCDVGRNLLLPARTDNGSPATSVCIRLDAFVPANLKRRKLSSCSRHCVDATRGLTLNAKELRQDANQQNNSSNLARAG